MLKYKLLALLVLISGAIFSQNTPPTATSIMEKTVIKYNSLSAFSFEFTVNMEEKGINIADFSGVLIVKQEKYYLTFEDQIMGDDGVMMWNYQKNTNEASLFDTEDDDFLIFHPLKMLNNWNKEYNVKFIREEEFQKSKVNILDLTFRQKSQYYKMRLFIDKNSSYIQQAIMYKVDGMTLTYTVTKFTPNVVVDDSKFIFNKKEYPDVQINDMR